MGVVHPVLQEKGEKKEKCTNRSFLFIIGNKMVKRIRKSYSMVGQVRAREGKVLFIKLLCCVLFYFCILLINRGGRKNYCFK